jgi:hypothetical protein
MTRTTEADDIAARPGPLKMTVRLALFSMAFGAFAVLTLMAFTH